MLFLFQYGKYNGAINQIRSINKCLYLVVIHANQLNTKKLQDITVEGLEKGIRNLENDSKVVNKILKVKIHLMSTTELTLMFQW